MHIAPMHMHIRLVEKLNLLCDVDKGTPTKRQVSKRQVYKTSGLQNVRFTKRQVYKTSGLQNVRFTKCQAKCQVFKTSGCKKHPFIFCTCGWWKSTGSVAAMLAGKVMAVFILYFRGFFAIYHHNK